MSKCRFFWTAVDGTECRCTLAPQHGHDHEDRTQEVTRKWIPVNR